MTTDYEFLVPTSCICMYKNIRVWRLWAPRWLGPVCLAHSAHPIATPLIVGNISDKVVNRWNRLDRQQTVGARQPQRL